MGLDRQKQYRKYPYKYPKYIMVFNRSVPRGSAILNVLSLQFATRALVTTGIEVGEFFTDGISGSVDISVHQGFDLRALSFQTARSSSTAIADKADAS